MRLDIRPYGISVQFESARPIVTWVNRLTWMDSISGNDSATTTAENCNITTFVTVAPRPIDALSMAFIT